jgi:hypothetical protein
LAVDSESIDGPSFLRGLPLALRAYAFARDAHSQQRRESDAAQFIVHPLEVASFGPDATAVYAADEVAKVRELRSRATRGEPVLDAHNPSAHAKLEHYRASLEMLERIAAEHPLVRQLRFELEILDGLPPRPDLLTADQP